jgi:hypothetical protein
LLPANLTCSAVESKPDQKTFFQLIRRNHAEVRPKIPDCIKKGEKTACTPEEQRDLFAEYFKRFVQQFRALLVSDSPVFGQLYILPSYPYFVL